MSITINIEDLLQQRIVESSRIEYKKDWNPSTIIHSICAFANDIENIGGGYILIGVEEDNGIPKLPISGISKERVDSILKNCEKPAILLSLYMNLKPNQYFMITSTSSSSKPQGAMDVPIRLPKM